MFLIAAGCSLENPKPNLGTLQVILKENPQQLLNNPAKFLVTSVPTTTSDFNCFGINVTGPGIIAERSLTGCTSENNLNGRGQGIVSELVTRGNPIHMDIPSGLERTIDVYGLFPTPIPCGGTATSYSGYLIGTRKADVLEGTSMTIPISYASSTASSITCSESSSSPTTNTSAQTVTLTVSSAVQGAQSGNICNSTLAASSSMSLTQANTTTFDTTNVSTSDNTMATAQCRGDPSIGNIKFVDFLFSVSGIDLSQYSRFSIRWLGRAGTRTFDNMTNQCPISQGTTFDAGGGSVWIYEAGINTWRQIGLSTDATPTILERTTEFTTPQNFVSNNTIYVRTVGPSASSSACSVVYTDYITITLMR